MSILSLLKNTMLIYQTVISVDEYGGDDTAWVLINSYRCRIEELNRDRNEYLGRDNTEATHRLYTIPSAKDDLTHESRIVVGTKTFEIVQYENLHPIISNSKLRHIEMYLKWMEQVPTI